MNNKGFALIPVIAIVGIVLVLGGIYLFNLNAKHSTADLSVTPTPDSNPSTSPEPTVSPTPSPKAGKSTALPAATTTSVSNCNTAKDVCFKMSNPSVTIIEGNLADANYWVSDQLTLTGKGSGGYTVSISGFPNQVSVRVPDQNFPDNGSEKILLRVQKDVTPKGSFHGTISVKSYISGVTTTANLTINYVDWNSSAIHTDPGQVNVDCTIKNNPDYPNSRQLDCGNYDSSSLTFYYYKNNKTIEVRAVPENSNKHTLSIATDSNHQTSFTNQDNTSMHYFATGFSDNLNEEPSATYKGYFVFVNQSTQSEILRTPYTISVHAYSP